MLQLKQPMGILGGTFDPVHNAHLQIALKLYDELNLSEVRLIPCKQPLLKEAAQTSNEERLDMLYLACQPYPQLRIDLRELIRETPSYMIETPASLRDDFPQTPLCLILGMDAFIDLPRWHKWEQLLFYTHLIVLSRPLFTPPSDPIFNRYEILNHTDDPDYLNTHLAGGIFHYHLPEMSQASRKIRQAIAEGKEVISDLPPAVWEYIKMKNLYGYKLS